MSHLQRSQRKGIGSGVGLTPYPPLCRPFRTYKNTRQLYFFVTVWGAVRLGFAVNEAKRVDFAQCFAEEGCVALADGEVE